MKFYYDAKYEYVDVASETHLDVTYEDKLQVAVRSRFAVFALWLIALVWVGGVLFFFIFPLLPNLQNVKIRAQRYNPYSLGYSMTTRLFTSLAPPVYDMTTLEEMSGGSERTLEYVDPTKVTVSNLEKKNTMLSIPSAHIHGKIVDGVSQDMMMKGFWHYPLSSVPGKRGNLVFIGHRFQKLPPNTDTFFNLDKVGVGDKVLLSQGDKEWRYTVVSTRVVEKDDTSVLGSSGDYRLTLITCTPLWTADQRLVVTAVLDSVDVVI